MANSFGFYIFWAIAVVNCFQISDFVLWQTAVAIYDDNNSGLWIAFKLVILSYGKQLDSSYVKEINAL